MNQIKTFEDLDAWRLGRKVTGGVYELTRNNRFSGDFGLCDQIRRAAVSIMTNVAEGFERGSNRDFARFLFIARASAGEVRSLLYVAMDQEYITQEDFNKWGELSIRASKTIWGLIKTVRAKPDWTTGAGS